MTERSPIFSAKGEGRQIGYIEGNEAFDLLERRRCNYNSQTGTLHDLNSQKIVGHITLEGKFAGISSIRDQLFPQSNGNPEQETHQREEPPNDNDREVADESVRQADDLDAHAVRSIGEPSSFPSERAEPTPVVTVSTEEPSTSEPTDDSERLGRVFEILRDRLGLSP